MNTSELRVKSIEELHKELNELLREQFNLRMQKGVGEKPRPHQFNRVRKNIARVKTIINQKLKEVLV